MDENKKRGAFFDAIFLKKNRRGSHIGMILSFVIFITFIVFLYSVVKPAINTGEDKKSILSSLEMEVIKNVSLNLTTASVQVNVNSGKNCIQLSNFLGFSEMYTPGIIAQDEQNNVETGYSNYNQGGSDVMIIAGNKNKPFFKIYHSTNFSFLPPVPSGTSCTSVTDYSIGSISTNKYAFENKIKYIMDYYKNNYDSLRTGLKITPGNDFGLGFTDSTGVKTEVGTAPEKASVFADEIPIQYVDKNANVLSGFINLKVW